MKNFDDEATQYMNNDNEATQFEGNKTADANKGITDKDTPADNSIEEAKEAKGGKWKHNVMSAGSGLLIGSVATLLMGMAKPEDTDNSSDGKDKLSHPEWVDDEIAVATSVNDDMSFGEAFAAAREEVGAGGCFEWRGNLYGTYTADEWNNMTAEERAEWSDHFSWNNIDHTESQVAQHSTTADHAASEEIAHATANDDEIEIVSVDHSDSDVVAQNQQEDNVIEVTDNTVIIDADPEIEILGVYHDDTTGANIGGMTIDGNDVILIDVNDDHRFDYMAVDANHNNKLEDDEIVEIQGHDITVNDLGGLSNPMADQLGDDSLPGYTEDSIYDA